MLRETNGELRDGSGTIESNRTGWNGKFYGSGQFYSSFSFYLSFSHSLSLSLFFFFLVEFSKQTVVYSSNWRTCFRKCNVQYWAIVTLEPLLK